MTIYYNPAYSVAPYRKNENSVDVGNIYCGDIQLLQRFLFYAGIPYLPVSAEERIAHYHAYMQGKVDASSPFYNSFKTDSAGMSLAVLGWRDALVEVGWNMKSYVGSSIKLSFIRDIEPEDMPRGDADYWNMLLQVASSGRILPEDTNVVVTCDKAELKPHIAHILSKQQETGVSVEYRVNEQPCANGNLGKIQKAILNETNEKITLDKSDDTFHYIQFTYADDALRYVATEPVDRSTVYFCSKPKRFDNTLRLLGKPAAGSSLASGSPQVVQLFVLGNGLFEYPLNIHRIIEWLNMPISPIRSKLRRALSNAMVSSGGIDNAEWDEEKTKFLDSIENEAERKKIAKQVDVFLPIPLSKEVDIERARQFNEDLRKWAAGLLQMNDFHYENIVREQIAAVESYCSTLNKMLDSAPAGFDFLDLQLWCKNIAQTGAYCQYDAEMGSHTTINAIGDIHEVAERVVWFPAEDSGTVAYPFDMLKNAEYFEVEGSGAMLYSREQHARINQASMLRILLNTKRLTIIEAENSNGEKVARHPLVLQLNERIEGGLKGIAQRKSISEEYTAEDHRVINQSETPSLVELGEQAGLKERHERESVEVKKAESYSSLSQLIQHPFTYVCEKCAKLKDETMPSSQDLKSTLGNVAHLIIEKVFDGRSYNEACNYFQTEYKTIFEESVNEKGLLLRLPEYKIELHRLCNKMFDALRMLAEVIKNNGLTVDACEYDFKLAKWREAGKDVMLGARADMLLSDSNGGKVIFDFKYSSSKHRKTEIEENRALQLEVYRYMAKQEFGENTPVRVAYIHLPDVTFFTADDLDLPIGQSMLNLETRHDADVMMEVANSYRLRWEQFKAGRIERVEGCSIGTGEYAEKQADGELFPLASYDKKVYDTDKFDKGYKNLK